MDKYTSKTGHQSGTQPLPHINHPTTNPKLDDVLDKFGCIECRSFPYDKDIDKAKQTILSDLLQLIGEDDVQIWDEQFWMCDRCDFQPTDDTKHCICYYRNQLRAELRQAIRAYCGVES